MQTQTGTVSADDLQNRVIGGTDVNWEQIEPGDWFSFIGDSEQPVSIQAVFEPGHSGNTTSDRWELTLVVNQVGGVRTDVNYTIHTWFSPNNNFPLFSPGDVQTAQILTRAFQTLDGLLTLNPSQSGKNHDEGNVTLIADQVVYPISFNLTITPAPTNVTLTFKNALDGADAIGFPWVLEGDPTTTGMQIRLLNPPPNGNTIMHWTADGVKPARVDLVYAASMTIDLNAGDSQVLTLTGGVTFAATANKAAKATAVHLWLSQPAATRTIAFNASWAGIGTIPTQQLSGKRMLIEIWCTGTAEGNVKFRCTSQL